MLRRAWVWTLSILPLAMLLGCGSRTDLGGNTLSGGGGASGTSSSTSATSSSSGSSSTASSSGTSSGMGGSMVLCGNGIVEPGELCDDGNLDANDACVSNCIPASCGDGVVWFGVEQCDDGNGINGDGCNNDCTLGFCGNGIVEFGEQCDLGPQNANRPAIEVVQGGLLVPSASPIDGWQDAPGFYGYASASSHTGYEALEESRLFFYRDLNTGELSLVMHHGIDFDTSGQHQPQGKAAFEIQNLPAQVYVAVADDQPNEFSKTSATSAAGNWNFNNNSDGGVLAGLPFPGTWSITISAKFDASIQTWAFVNGGLLYGIAMGQPVTLKAYNSPAACRLDCTIPVCGDGIVDGGEACDDGNKMNGDGCAANCLAVFP